MRCTGTGIQRVSSQLFTGLGWSGSKQFDLFKSIVVAITVCKAFATSPAEKLSCNLNQIGIPIVERALAGTDVPSKINGRVSLFACQVNARASTLDNSISMATNSWSSNADVLANIMVSDQIACFTTNTFYNVFRGEFGGSRIDPTRCHRLSFLPPHHPFHTTPIPPGAPYIDGGYCTDYAQMCPKDLTKCLKISTEFLGPNLPAGTPFPTEQSELGGGRWKAGFLRWDSELLTFFFIPPQTAPASSCRPTSCRPWAKLTTPPAIAPPGRCPKAAACRKPTSKPSTRRRGTSRRA